MKYKITLEYMHGDADKYETQSIIFNPKEFGFESDEEAKDAIELIEKYLKAYEQDRYFHNPIVEELESNDAFSDFCTSELTKGDCTADCSFLAGLESYTIEPLKEKKKRSPVALEVTNGCVSVKNLLAYLKYRESIMDDPEDEYNSGFNHGIEHEFDALKKALK